MLIFTKYSDVGRKWEIQVPLEAPPLSTLWLLSILSKIEERLNASRAFMTWAFYDAQSLNWKTQSVLTCGSFLHIFWDLVAKWWLWFDFIRKANNKNKSLCVKALVDFTHTLFSTSLKPNHSEKGHQTNERNTISSKDLRCPFSCSFLLG